MFITREYYGYVVRRKDGKRLVICATYNEALEYIKNYNAESEEKK